MPQQITVYVRTLNRYRIRGKFRGMKISLYRKQTGFSQLYFRGSLIPEECCVLKMCVLTEITRAIGLNNMRGVAAAFNLAFMIHSLTNTALYTWRRIITTARFVSVREATMHAWSQRRHHLNRYACQVLMHNCKCCKLTNFRGLNFRCIRRDREIREIYIPRTFLRIR